MQIKWKSDNTKMSVQKKNCAYLRILFNSTTVAAFRKVLLSFLQNVSFDKLEICTMNMRFVLETMNNP